MPTYGQRPQDLVTDSRGNALRGVTLKLYSSEADALAGGTADGTAVTDNRGRWSYTSDGEVWARLSDGSVWQVAATPVTSTGPDSLTIVASGATVTTADGDTDGQLVGYWVKTGTAVINGVTCLPGVHIFAWDASVPEWGIATIGAVDTTPPTAGVMSVTTVDVTSLGVSVTGALDETALDASPYSFSSDNGSTWSAWQAGPTYTYTGLTESTSYDLKHRVRDAAGNITEGATVTQSTSASITWAPVATWDFTAADGTELNGLAPSSGTGVTLTAPATDLGLSPARYVQVQSNKAFLRWSGTSVGPMTFTRSAAETLGLGVEFDWVAADNTFTGLGRITIGTNAAGTNQAGFNVANDGTINFYHNAAGSTSYTAEPGAPTVVPKTATIRVEFTPGGTDGCTGRLYVDGVLYGTITSTGWTWQGKHLLLWANNNQQTVYTWDNLTVEALS